jgi:cell pole-organizing protein PopZ
MEEILASIRKIIAEDPSPAVRAPSSRKNRSAEAAPPEPEDRVGESPETPPSFEARFEAAREEIDIPPAPELDEPGAAASDEEILELTDIADDPAILSAATASAAAERFSKLSEAMSQPNAGALTLDALVREMLRPMLKDWLDAHLPDIVDQVVAREIARLTGKGR